MNRRTIESTVLIAFKRTASDLLAFLLNPRCFI